MANAPGTKKPCYFYNHGGCQNSDEKCKFAHVHVTADEKAKMVKPQRVGSRSPSPGSRGQGGRGSGGVNPAGPGQSCRFFPKGTCKRGDDCPFSHMSKEETERIEKARAKAKAQPKAKGKAKAKAAPATAATLADFMPFIVNSE